MQPRHPLTLALCCAFALAACKETPPPNDRTALTTPTASELRMTTPIDSTTAPGTPASDATPSRDAPAATPGSDSTPVGTTSPANDPPTATTTTAASTAIDSPATNPMAPLSKEDEKMAMPMAGQAGSHSSPSLHPKAKE